MLVVAEVVILVVLVVLVVLVEEVMGQRDWLKLEL
jgi:hypothetical protein